MTSTVRSSVSFPRPVLNGAADDLATRRAAALSTLHDLVVGVNGHRDLASTLHAVTAAACALGFGVAVVNLVRTDGALEVVAVAGDEGARSELLGKVRPREAWDELLAMGQEEHGVVFIDHREVTWPEQGVLASWVAETDAEEAEDPDAYHPDDALFVRMVGSDGELVGTLSVDLPVDGRRPSPETRELLGTFGSHAALAIDHARLLRDLRSERADQDVLVRRLEALLELSRQLAATSDRARVVEVVTAALPEVVGSDEAGLLLWDPDRGALHGAGTVGLDGPRREALLSAVLTPKECPEVLQILTLRGPLVLDAGTASPVMGRLLGVVGVVGALAVPIQAGDVLLGVVTASWGGRPVPSSGRTDTTARLGAVADLASTALQNADLVEAVRHQSRHDELTGLPNRRLLGEHLDQLLRGCADDDGVAVLYCDLDGFKSVNDSLGHGAGDELLRQAAARLRRTVRPTDVVGRLGGDEFALLLPGSGDELVAEAVARRVTSAFARPFRVEGRQVSVTTSVGVAVHRGRGGRPGVLLGAADTAMYRAKRTGRNHVCSAGADVADGPAASLEGELALAVEGGQLRLHFQPIVDVVTGRDVGAEALLRWQHPRLGLLPPGAFLSLAEEAGLMAALDTWVLRAACDAAARWPGAGSSTVTVNVSGSSLADPRLPELVRCVLAESGLPARRLCLEVVESRSLVDLPGVVERLTAVRRLGVQVALDDFGTGFSTLTWLQHLPVDVVKVDRTFTAALGDDGSEALLRGVLALAGEVGVEVVTEGVETPRQLELVRAAGCRRVQGYLLGRPLPAAEWSLRLAGPTDPAEVSARGAH